MEAFVVTNIASIPNIHVEVAKETYSHLTDVWSSNFCRNDDSLEVHCPIGSDKGKRYEGTTRTCHGKKQLGLGSLLASSRRKNSSFL